MYKYEWMDCKIPVITLLYDMQIIEQNATTAGVHIFNPKDTYKFKKITSLKYS